MSAALENLRNPLEASVLEPALAGQAPGSRRFIATAVSLSLLALGVWLAGRAGGRHAEIGALLQFLGAVVAAVPLTVQLWRGITDRADEQFSDQLVVLAVFGALATREYATAVLVPAVMDLGHLLEQQGIRGVQAAIAGLQRLSAQSAVVMEATGERRVAAHELCRHDLLVVRPGDILAADGVIETGSASLDEASITGESLPRAVGVGDAVHAGCTSIDGMIHVRITQTGDQTSLGRIRSLLAAAGGSKAPIVRLLERYSELYVPVVLMLAAFVFLLTRQSSRVIAVFVVSCPCALVLAAPSAMIAALACATRHGILVKNSKFLESLATADTVIFDKTGTVTQGRLDVVDVVTVNGDRESVLRSAAICAAASTHPISRAITRYSGFQSIPAAAGPVDGVCETSGAGVELTRAGRRLRLGRASWLTARGVAVPEIPQHAGPVVCVAEADRLVGFILLNDSLRREAARTVADLRKLGIARIILLTGDRAAAAEPIVAALGCDQFQAEALPHEKLAFVQQEKLRGRKVVVVGDGVNDALALAAGDIGIAMGARGSDVAIQSADVALMTNDLGRVSFAIQLAQRTQSIMRQNVVIALGSAVVMLSLSSLGTITALLGAVLHNLGTAGVLFNSARLIRVRAEYTDTEDSDQ